LPFAKVKEAATEMRDRLKALKLTSFAMITGGKGIHVVVPLAPRHTWDQHKAFAEGMARLMAEDDPARYLAVMSKAKRKGKIFIDYLRNGRGATAIAPYSTRARPGAFIAQPVSWTALGKLKSAQGFHVGDDVKTLTRGKDPWAGYHDVRQALPKL
jgi:bifunctional non-homologous end joining protein LigD